MRTVAFITVAFSMAAFLVLYYTHATRDLVAALWFGSLAVVFFLLIPRNKK